jgi:hypothetical protein
LQTVCMTTLLHPAWAKMSRQCPAQELEAAKIGAPAPSQRGRRALHMTVSHAW